MAGANAEGTLQDAQRAVMWSRLASRVLWPIAEFDCPDELALYAGVYGLRGRDARRRMAEIVELGGLGARLAEAAGGLPMGLRQRLALGCALLHRRRCCSSTSPPRASTRPGAGTSGAS